MRRMFALLIIAGLIVFGTMTALAQQNVIYTVRGGDTVGTIAAQFGVSQQSIINANNLTNPNVLFAGQLLTIPVPAAPVVVQPAPTQQFGTGGPSVIVAPNNPAVSPTATPIPVVVQPAPTQQFGTGGPVVASGQTYTVVTGEGLYEIAVRFGTTAEAIAAVNGITNINAIQAGQVLRLPQGVAPTTAEQLGTGGPVANPAVRPFQYVVQPGDYVELLAVRFGTTIAAIDEANDLDNVGFIFPGEVLTIP